jgi:hypothetical protein
MNKKTFIYRLLATMLLIGCRPPMKFVKNKSKYFLSTRSKNSKSTERKVNTEGTYVLVDSTNVKSAYSLIKFNTNQTVQVSEIRTNSNLKADYSEDNYLQNLSNKVSYYYYFDLNSQKFRLERFEYWDAPWWNFFVQTNHYLVEEFSLKGDTLYNQRILNYTRFGKTYVLDNTLVKNFEFIGNEFVIEKESPKK